MVSSQVKFSADRQTDRQTPVKQYAPDLSMPGHKNSINLEFALFNPFPNKPWFLRVCITSLLKTLWEKEKLLVNNNFSFFHSIFYPFRELFVIFIKFEIVACKLF